MNKTSDRKCMHQHDKSHTCLSLLSLNLTICLVAYARSPPLHSQVQERLRLSESEKDQHLPTLPHQEKGKKTEKEREREEGREGETARRGEDEGDNAKCNVNGVGPILHLLLSIGLRLFLYLPVCVCACLNVCVCVSVSVPAFAAQAASQSAIQCLDLTGHCTSGETYQQRTHRQRC